MGAWRPGCGIGFMKVSPVHSYVSCVPCPMSFPCYVSIQCLLCLSCVWCLSSTSCLFERCHSAGEPISSGSMTAWLRYQLYEGVPCPILCLNLMSLRCLTSPMSLKLSSAHVLLIRHYYHLTRASNLKQFLFQADLFQMLSKSPVTENC